MPKSMNNKFCDMMMMVIRWDFSIVSIVPNIPTDMAQNSFDTCYISKWVESMSDVSVFESEYKKLKFTNCLLPTK